MLNKKHKKSKTKNDKFLKIITVCSLVEMLFIIILMFTLLGYYIGVQGGDYIINAVFNKCLIIFSVIFLIILWGVKFVLKQKRLEYLILCEK